MEWYYTLGLALVVLGLVLLVAEFFFPTGGIFVVLGFLACGSAVGLVIVYGERREWIAAVLAICVGMPISIFVLFKAWSRLSLRGVLASETLQMTVAKTPEALELEQLPGKIGKTLSPMRPSGTVDFEGRRVDAMSEGLMIEANVWVKCIAVQVGRVIVRQTDAPSITE